MAAALQPYRPPPRLYLIPLLLFLTTATTTTTSTSLGVNYGQLGNNLPSPTRSVELIKTLRAGRVKLYDANPSILLALSGAPVKVSVMVPDNLISPIAANQSLADDWVRSNLLPFYPSTQIRYLLVGNEMLSAYYLNQTWPDLVPAMARLKRSIDTHFIRNVKVGTPLAMDVLQSSFPPSNGAFRSDIAEAVMIPLLQFLNRTNSFYFVDVYPYVAWSDNHNDIQLDYALFKASNMTYTDPTSRLTYTNLLDQQLDAVIFAMERLGFKNVRLLIAETGWPSAGDYDQIGANVFNAATYNRNLARRMTAKPPVGTPARPGVPITSFVFSLYNENQKPGPATERHWGLFFPNGSAVYGVDLSGKTPDSAYPPLPPPMNDKPYMGKLWCVAVRGEGVNATELAAAMSYACGLGNGTCDAIQPGKPCYEPDSLVSHASYAFNSYWQQFRQIRGTCFLGGFAVETLDDPSYGSCKYPSVAAD